MYFTAIGYLRKVGKNLCIWIIFLPSKKLRSVYPEPAGPFFQPLQWMTALCTLRWVEGG